MKKFYLCLILLSFSFSLAHAQNKPTQDYVRQRIANTNRPVSKMPSADERKRSAEAYANNPSYARINARLKQGGH